MCNAGYCENDANFLGVRLNIRQGNELNPSKSVDMNSVECRNYGNCDLNQLYEYRMNYVGESRVISCVR